MILTQVSLLFAYGLAFWPSLTCDLRPTLRDSAWNINTTEGSDNQKKWLLASITMGRKQAVRHNEGPASGGAGPSEGLPTVSVFVNIVRVYVYLNFRRLLNLSNFLIMFSSNVS
jgi:hypothetical protein